MLHCNDVNNQIKSLSWFPVARCWSLLTGGNVNGSKVHVMFLLWEVYCDIIKVIVHLIGWSNDVILYIMCTCSMCISISSVSVLSYLDMSLKFALVFSSIQDGFMKNFPAQQTMWATDWPVTRRTTQNPTPLQSTPPSHFCPSTLITHNQSLLAAAVVAAPPPCQRTPSLLRRTRWPYSNTPQYQVCLLLPPEWPHTHFPKSNMSEATSCYKLKPPPQWRL